MDASMNGSPTGGHNRQEPTSSIPVSQIFVQLNQLYAKLQGFYPEWSQQNSFWSIIEGLSDAQLCQLHVNWTGWIEHSQTPLHRAVLTGYVTRSKAHLCPHAGPFENSDTVEQREGMNEIDQGLNHNLEVWQSSESLACDGLGGGIHAISFPGVGNGEQAGNPRPLGFGENHELITRDQDDPVPPASLPLTSMQVDATRDNSTIR
jgi:hypothetical protein